MAKSKLSKHFKGVFEKPRGSRDYVSKAKKVRKKFGSRVAAEIKPKEIGSWLSEAFKTPATSNRYKSFLSLCYREGMANDKVEVNPARLVRQQPEATGRIRYLSRDAEYPRLHAVIAERFPVHLAEFVVSVHTGMRLSEQYTCTWAQFDPVRKVIDLTRTKNSSPRTIHLNREAMAAIESRRKPTQKWGERIFPRATKKGQFDNRSWFRLCLEEAGIVGYVWHSNRHTFCSWLAMAGVTIKEIQEAAGHKTIAMAARYSHLLPKHKLSVVERIVDRKMPGE